SSLLLQTRQVFREGAEAFLLDLALEGRHARVFLVGLRVADVAREPFDGVSGVLAHLPEVRPHPRRPGRAARPRRTTGRSAGTRRIAGARRSSRSRRVARSGRPARNGWAAGTRRKTRAGGTTTADGTAHTVDGMTPEATVLHDDFLAGRVR